MMTLNDEEIRSAGRGAAIDQLIESLRDLAVALSIYYAELIRGGVSQNLAEELVAQWHRHFWGQWEDEE